MSGPFKTVVAPSEPKDSLSENRKKPKTLRLTPTPAPYVIVDEGFVLRKQIDEEDMESHRKRLKEEDMQAKLANYKDRLKYVYNCLTTVQKKVQNNDSAFTDEELAYAVQATKLDARQGMDEEVLNQRLLPRSGKREWVANNEKQYVIAEDTVEDVDFYKKKGGGGINKVHSGEYIYDKNFASKLNYVYTIIKAVENKATTQAAPAVHAPEDEQDAMEVVQGTLGVEVDKPRSKL